MDTKRTEQLSPEANHILSVFIDGFESESPEEISIAGSKSASLPDTERKALKGEIMSFLLNTNSKFFDIFNSEVDIIVDTAIAPLPITLTTLYNAEQSLIQGPDPERNDVLKLQQAKCREYLSTFLLPSSPNFDLQNISQVLQAAISNPSQIFKDLKLLDSHNITLRKSIKGSVISKISLFNKSRLSADELEIKRWISLYLEHAPTDQMKNYESAQPNELLNSMLIDINYASKELTGREPFNLTNPPTIDYSSKGGVSDIAFIINNKIFASDVTVSEEADWEGNQFIRHHSELVGMAIKKYSPDSINPLLENGDFKKDISLEDITQFCDLSKELKVNYEMLPALESTQDGAEKAAAYMYSSQLSHSSIGTTTICPTALKHYFDQSNFNFIHKHSSVFFSKTDIQKEYNALPERVLRADSKISWSSSNQFSRKNLTCAVVAIISNFNTLLKKNNFSIKVAVQKLTPTASDNSIAEISKILSPEYISSIPERLNLPSSKADKASFLPQMLNNVCENTALSITNNDLENTNTSLENTINSLQAKTIAQELEIEKLKKLSTQSNKPS